MASINYQIKLLPEHIIDQIKAGEVIERPANLLKELLENSIDAKSSEINIHIVASGLELLEISDNGHGISFENLPFAFLRHATSKIDKFEDLYDLYSFGFRGEALASVASISRLTCISFPQVKKDGGKIILHGGETKLLQMVDNEDPSHHGTSLFIQDLFYNTPARLKFIRSKLVEKNAIKKVLEAFLLCFPQIKFIIKWDDGEKKFFPAVKPEDYLKRFQKVLTSSSSNKKGEDFSTLKIEVSYDQYSLDGYITKGQSEGKNKSKKKHFLFINKRLVADKAIHSLIIQTIESYWGQGNYGHYCLFLTIPPHHLDVNVHPNKTLVKLSRPSTVFSLVSSGLKKSLDAYTLSLKISDKNGFKNDHSQGSPINSAKETQYISNQNGNNFFPSFQKGPPLLPDIKPPLAKKIGLGIESLINQNDYSPEIPLILWPTREYFLWQSPHLSNTDKNIYYFVQAKKLLGVYCFQQIDNNFPFKEEEILPLLISEQIPLNSSFFDNYLFLLKDWGLEFDRIDSTNLLLRTLPKFFEKFFLQEIIPGLIKFLQVETLKNKELRLQSENRRDTIKEVLYEENKIKGITKFFQKSVKEYFLNHLTLTNPQEISQNFYQKILLSFKEEDFIHANGIVMIKDSLLQKIFCNAK